ncbi:MAG TPA: hypothetical protein DHV59_19190 [Oxalobacteraceae bacterium]|nr:hypothetical protein [Oxalobacteraceae bacterium]
MQTTFQTSDSGQAVIQNATAIGSEKLVVTLHPESDSSVAIQIREDTGGQDLVSSEITINQAGLQQLVQWLRAQGVVD